MSIFTISIDQNTDFAALQEVMDAAQDETAKFVENLAKDLDCSVPCAWDVWYLRSRSRWTKEKEKELIRLHKEGNPPNVLAGDF